jgi:hypothetical protein
MILMVLGELYLPLSLRGDEKNIGDHQTKGEVLGNCWSKKKHSCLQYDSFTRIREVLGNCWSCSY